MTRKRTTGYATAFTILAIAAALTIWTPDAKAVATVANCTGLTSPVTKLWDLSTDGHETLHNLAADKFITTTQYPGVTYNGSSAGFADNGIAHNALGSFSPGPQDFSACVGFQVDDHNGVNMYQCGTNGVVDGVHGYFKLTPWGAVVQGTLAGTAGYVPSGVHGLALNGTGWHILGLQRTGDTFRVYLDGALTGTKTAHVGSVDISGRSCSIGGKWYDANPDKLIGPDDMLNGRLAWVKVGLG